MAGNSKTEETPYTTLTYGTSYKGFQVDPERLQRQNPALEDTTDWEYEQQAAINTNENLHGGSDVTLHARGKSDMLIDRYIYMYIYVVVQLQVPCLTCSTACTSRAMWHM